MDASPERDSFGPGLTLRSLRKSFGATAVLEDLDLSIPGGRFTVLLGGSGCGKTTCLRLIAGLEEPSGGSIRIGDRDVTALPPAQRGVAMVFQSYALFPHLSVAENILFGMKARGVSRAEREARLKQAAELLGIGSLLARKPGQISGGQQQRVALGRAIVAEAPVCLMDEPLSNLDAQLRAEMRREIVALQRRLGLTMIYVTHDQTEAMSMADLVVVLRAGRLEQAAAPADLYERPANAYVAGFIGTPPMNVLPLEALELDLPPGRRRLLAGLRPEALSLSPPANDAAALTMRVDHAEYLGADTVLTGRFRPGGPSLQARLPGRCAAAPGEMVRLFYAPAALHLFDAETGARIDRAPVRPLPVPATEDVP